MDCIKYDRNTLLNLWDVNYRISITDYDGHSDILRPNSSPSHDFQIPKCKQRKRGKRAGALVRFRRRISRPPLPSIFLSNLRSINNKTDELFYLISNFRDYRDCSIFCFTETWLENDTPNSSMCPDGFVPHRLDRSNELAEKEGSGGGICFLINDRWCDNDKSKTIFEFCSHDLETLVVECKPTYSPREFSSIILVGAYVPGSVQSAVTTLASQISAIENSHPNSFVIVLGDFNQTSLTKELPNYKQQVKCPTHEKNNTLDHCYCTIKNAYHAIPRPPLGLSDHFMLYLLPSYKQKLKTAKPRVSKVKCTDNNSLT